MCEEHLEELLDDASPFLFLNQQWELSLLTVVVFCNVGATALCNFAPVCCLASRFASGRGERVLKMVSFTGDMLGSSATCISARGMSSVFGVSSSECAFFPDKCFRDDGRVEWSRREKSRDTGSHGFTDDQAGDVVD